MLSPCNRSNAHELWLRARLQDLDKEDNVAAPYREAPADEVKKLAAEHAARRKRTDKSHSKRLGLEGFEVEAAGEVLS